MEWRKLSALLEKYYEGNSTTEEEKYLREQLQREDLPPEFHPDRDVFTGWSAAAGEEPSAGFEQRLKSVLEREIRKGYRLFPPVKKLVFYSVSAAAGLILVAASYFVMQTAGLFRAGPDETYADPRLAYQETKNTLILVSSYLNKGTEPLEQLKKLESGTSDLKYIKVLNNGMDPLGSLQSVQKVAKKMEPLGKIEEVKQLLK